MSTIKSPLRYPGGKTRAIPYLREHLPKVTSIVSPFFGGGSFELDCISRGIKVKGYDNFAPLVNFWDMALLNPKHLADKVEQRLMPMSKPLFYQCRDEVVSDWASAANFYALNRCSFSGLGYLGGYSKTAAETRFTKKNLDRLRNFKAPGLTVRHADFTKTLMKHPKEFLFCDPPYYTTEKLYGKTANNQFPHKLLAHALMARPSGVGFMLCYNDCDTIRELYKGCRIIEVTWSQSHWGTGSGSEDVRRPELIITKPHDPYDL